MDKGSKQFFTMTDPRQISILDYTYELPDERIALHPLAERDASKLLVYKEGNISESVYARIDEHLPANSYLVFNNTRVIRARIRFQKETGGWIEIFCLEPYETISEYSSIMNRTGNVKWKCLVGGAGKWKSGDLHLYCKYGDTGFVLSASMIEKLPDAYVINFSWTPEQYSFAEVIEAAGDIPLPPYIKRETAADDTERYQTIYAQDEGSVAAPTAGLHFSERVFASLKEKGIETDFVTLHVGAGTFKPVKAERMEGHEMHAEWIDVNAASIQKLIDHQNDYITAVGTTSLRTLESLYWLGVKASLDPEAAQLNLLQWDVYETPITETGLSVKEALTALLEWLRKNKRQHLFTQTQLLIVPGYRFRVVKALITNFHQPQSTLLLLVAAATKNEWRKLYDYAMSHDFRFLSYGDGSLLFLNEH